MAQADALAVQAAADLVLYQAGFADGVASVPVSGGITPVQEQADIAAAVAAAVGPLNDTITQLQGQLTAAQTSLSADNSVIQGLQASVTQIQTLAAQLAAIVIPAPAPAST